MNKDSLERLKQYCADVCFIDGLQTFIISPSKHDDILKDDKLLKCLKRSESDLFPFMKTTKEVGTDKIYLAFVYLPAKVDIMQWFPIHCYKNGNQFYHVYYRKSWMCRECGNIIYKSIVMPMVEVESLIYQWPENRYPDIPTIFQKIKCPECGKPLQNHLIIIK